MTQHTTIFPKLFVGGILVAGLLFALWPFGQRMKVLANVMAAGGTPVTIYAHSIDLFPEDPERKLDGPMSYIGGFVLTSSDKRFGGFSALAINSDASQMLAVSDQGLWMTAHLTEAGAGQLAITNAQLAPMLDENGDQLSRRFADSESIATVEKWESRGDLPDVFIGFESKDRVDRYNLSDEGILARPTRIAMPPSLLNARLNKGLESLGWLPSGSLLGIAEATFDAQNNHVAWLVPLDGGNSAELSLRRSVDYDPTDLAVAPNGDIYVLERRVSRIGGWGMRIRHIDGDQIKANAILDGETVLELGAASAIDNMEALAVRQDQNGRLIFYLMSDDNFKGFQNTVLLMFQMETSN